jgi:hypothetical protein
MANTSMGVQVGKPEKNAPPMVELTLVDDDGEAHRFWFVPDAARDFAGELIGYADEADRLRLSQR